MTISFSDIDQLLILVDVDDPATYDPSFQKHLEFGGFVKSYPVFSEENREIGRSEGSAIARKFVIEVYTDRFHDFVYRCLPSDTHHRSLMFKCINTKPFSIGNDENMDDLEEVQYIYEMKTLGVRKSADAIEDLEFEAVDEEEGSEEDAGPVELTHFTSPKMIH